MIRSVLAHFQRINANGKGVQSEKSREAKELARSESAQKKELKNLVARARQTEVLTRQILLLRRTGTLNPATAEPEHVVIDASTGPLDAIRLPIDGMSFYVPATSHPGDNFRNRLIEKRNWPVDAVAASLPVVRGGVMLDIGANIGLTSIPRAALGLFEHVHAFEPEPINFACLAAGLRENGLPITAWNTALGESTGTANLIVKDGMARHRIDSGGTGAGARVQVPVSTLNEWLDEAAVDPRTVTFVKIDTQGYEPRILAGASRLLRIKNVIWQLEYSPMNMEAAGSSVAEYHQLLRRHFVAVMDFRDRAAGFHPIADLEMLIRKRDQTHHYTDLIVVSSGLG